MSARVKVRTLGTTAVTVIIVIMGALFASCSPSSQGGSPLPRDKEIGRVARLTGADLIAYNERHLRGLPERFPDPPPGRVVLPYGPDGMTGVSLADRGSRVLIVGRGNLEFSRQIKILEGWSTGDTGWVRSNWIEIMPSQGPNMELIEAARNGDKSSVKRLLKGGIDAKAV